MTPLRNISISICFIILLATCNGISFSIQPTRTAVLTPYVANSNEAGVVIASYNEVSISSAWPPANWIVNVAQTDTFHLGVSAAPGGNWGFDPVFISAITVQIDSPTIASATFDDIMIAFTNPGTSGDDYIAVRLFMDNSEANIISPFCDTSSDPSKNTKMTGLLSQLPNTDRICDVMNNCSGADYDEYEPLNIAPQPSMQENNAFPIKFTVINYPTPGFMHIYYESAAFSTNFEQKCGYSAFPTNEGLQMFLAVNAIGQMFEISQFTVDYYVFTQAPTSSPTTAVPTTTEPTATPTTAQPTETPTTAAPTTAAPTLNPDLVTLWHQEMAVLATSNWTTSSKAIALAYRDGSDGGCPLNSIPTCWALCAANFNMGRGFTADRSVSTQGFQNIALTFSVDPWSMTLPNTYCEVSYSVDAINWTPIGAQYHSADHIVDETVFLEPATWDANNVAVRIETVGDTATNCCYMSDWYLSGTVITETPTSNPTAMPTFAPTTAEPTTSYPTTSPTTTEPTTAVPTTSNPSNAPTFYGQTSNPSRAPTSQPTTFQPTSTPTTAVPTTAVPTTSNPTTSQPTTVGPTTAVLELSMAPTRNNDGRVDGIQNGDEHSTADQDNDDQGEDAAKSDLTGFMGTDNMLLYAIMGGGICSICLLLIGILVIRNRKRKKSMNEKAVDNMASAMSGMHDNRLQSVASQSNLEMTGAATTKIISSPSTEYEGNVYGTEFNTNLESLQIANDLLMEDVVDEMEIMNGIENDDDNEVDYVTKGGPNTDDMHEMDDDDLLPGPQTLGGMDIDILVNNTYDCEDEDAYIPPPPQPPMDYNEGGDGDGDCESDEDVVGGFTTLGGPSSGLMEYDEDAYVPPPPLPPTQLMDGNEDELDDDDVVMEINYNAETVGR